MSRKRIIDTELYFDTDLYDILGDRGLHLYIRLWGIAEDSGVYTPNYSDISLQLGALKFSSEEVKKLIKNLIKAKKILVFHENKREFHWLKNFLKHQTLNNPPPPKLPLPKWLKCVHHKFKSGKEYVKYSTIQSELLVIHKATAGITSSLPVAMKRNETKRNETNRNRIETETLSPLSPHGAAIVADNCKPGGGNGTETERDVLIKRFNIFKQAYPKWSKGPVVEQLFFELHPDEQLFSIIISGLKTLKKCDEWKRESGRFIPSPDNFLRDHRWEDKLPQPTIFNTPPVSVRQNLSPEDLQKFDQAKSEGLKKIKETLHLPITNTS